MNTKFLFAPGIELPGAMDLTFLNIENFVGTISYIPAKLRLSKSVFTSQDVQIRGNDLLC